MTILSPFYLRPIWQISLDGRDLSETINPRFMSMSLSESRDDEADQLDLELTDHDGLLAIPERHVVIRLAIGWEHTGLVDKGTFTVDEVGHRGAPDIITLRARSADMTGPLRTRNERSFHDKSIQEIATDIALANELEAVVGEAFARKKIPHIDQSNESDMAFLNRIGKRYDAVATVKEAKLLFMPIQGAKTASGQELPVVRLLRTDGDNHEFLMSARDAYTGVKAYWRDTRSTKRRSIVVGVLGNTKQLRDTFANEQDALAETQAEWQRIQRGMATLTFSAAVGVPNISPQQRVEFPTMKPPISDIQWLVKRLQHSISESGFTTRFELEQFDKPDIDEYDDIVEIEG